MRAAFRRCRPQRAGYPRRLLRNRGCWIDQHLLSRWLLGYLKLEPNVLAMFKIKYRAEKLAPTLRRFCDVCGAASIRGGLYTQHKPIPNVGIERESDMMRRISPGNR
jgi:hypothetical protein